MVAYPSFLLVIDPHLKLSIVEKYMQEHELYKAKMEATLEGRRECS